ncbi:uncharacterized protein [Diadema setosum]|uniref:uncharacterized protein n=1 Tax=Diadema setosum TaxID=31175 RepID=UPI003B3AC469
MTSIPRPATPVGEEKAPNEPAIAYCGQTPPTMQCVPPPVTRLVSHNMISTQQFFADSKVSPLDIKSLLCTDSESESFLSSVERKASLSKTDCLATSRQTPPHAATGLSPQLRQSPCVSAASGDRMESIRGDYRSPAASKCGKLPYHIPLVIKIPNKVRLPPSRDGKRSNEHTYKPHRPGDGLLKIGEPSLSTTATLFAGQPATSRAKAGGISKKRTSFTHDQVHAMEVRFEQQRYLTSVERKELAALIGLDDNTVKVWFQNRRSKLKKRAEVSSSSGGFGNGAVQSHRGLSSSSIPPNTGLPPQPAMTSTAPQDFAHPSLLSIPPAVVQPINKSVGDHVIPTQGATHFAMPPNVAMSQPAPSALVSQVANVPVDSQLPVHAGSHHFSPYGSAVLPDVRAPQHSSAMAHYTSASSAISPLMSHTQTYQTSSSHPNSSNMHLIPPYGLGLHQYNPYGLEGSLSSASYGIPGSDGLSSQPGDHWPNAPMSLPPLSNGFVPM